MRNKKTFLIPPNAPNRTVRKVIEQSNIELKKFVVECGNLIIADYTKEETQLTSPPQVKFTKPTPFAEVELSIEGEVVFKIKTIRQGSTHWFEGSYLEPEESRESTRP